MRPRSKSLPTFFVPQPFPIEIESPEDLDCSDSDFELGSDEEIEKIVCQGNKK